MAVKVCKSCHVEKNVNDFGLHSSTADGYRSVCYECRRKERADNQEVINSRRRELRDANLDEAHCRAREYHHATTNESWLTGLGTEMLLVGFPSQEGHWFW